MENLWLGILGLVLLLVFIFFGLNLPTTFFVIGFFGIVIMKGWSTAFVLTEGVPFNELSGFNWSVIPLFVFMGMVIFHCKIGEEIFRAVRVWLGHFSGGIAAATSGACAIIGTMTGSGAATSALMAKVAYPEMVKYKYDKAFSLATCAASSTAAMMVPPSIQIVVMAILAQVSIGKALLAGFIPGFMSMGIYMLMILLRVRFNPKMAPKLPPEPWKERAISLVYLIPAVLMTIVIAGGIYFGVFTATEAGGMGAAAVLIIAGAMKRLTWPRIKAMVFETIGFSVMIMLMLVTIVGFYTRFLNITNITGIIAEAALAFPSPWITLALVLLVTLVFGMFIGSTLAYVTIPLFAPVLHELGFDLVWFVIIMIKMAETGSITPPICLSLFIAQGIQKDVDMGKAYRAVWWFVGADIFTLVLMIAFPQIVMFLPNTAKG